jgi:membrane-associated phospholipid phosphatase
VTNDTAAANDASATRDAIAPHGDRVSPKGDAATGTVEKPKWDRALGVGLGLLLLALLAARTSSAWIAKAFPDRPVPRDLLFEVLPHIPKLGWVVDLAVVASAVLVLAYALRGHRRELPKIFALYGLMQLSRAVVNLLTPLGSPLHHAPYYGMTGAIKVGDKVAHINVPQNGEFPSGHMATVFLLMLVVDRAQSPRIKTTLAVLTFAEMIALLMSHQHYSIDIVGGLLLSYVIYHEYESGKLLNWLKRLVKV